MNVKEASAPGRVERKKEATKQRIISVAIKLFKEKGVDMTTMEEIAMEADIAKGTLYNYFPVKEAIISEYIQKSFRDKSPHRIKQLQEMPDTRSRIVLILNELMEGVQAQKEIFEKYLVYQIRNMISLRRDAVIKSGFEQLGIEIIKLGQKSGEIRKDLPLEILAAFFGFVFIEVAQQFYTEPEQFKAGEVIEQCVNLFMDGVNYKE